MRQNLSSANSELRAISCLAMLNGGMISGSVSAILVPITAFFDLRIGQAAFPMVFSMMGLLSASFITLFAWRIHRARFLLTLSSSCLLLSLLGIGFWHNSIEIVLTLLFFVGVSRGVVQIGVMSLFSELFGRSRVKYLNISLFFFGLGAFIGPLLVGIVLTYGGEWYVVYFLLELISLPLPVLFYRKRLYRGAMFSKKQMRHEVCQEKKPVSSSFFWVIVLAAFTLVGVQGSFHSWMPLFLVEIKGVSAVGASYSVSIFWLSMLGGRMLYGHFLHEADLSRSLVVGVCGAALFTFLSFSFSRTVLIVPSIVCSGLLLSFVSPGLVALGGNVFPKQIGFITGALAASASTGSMFFPWVVGATSQSLGVARGVLVIPVLAVVVAVILIYSRYSLAKKINWISSKAD